jgi:hypothetical protein
MTTSAMIVQHFRKSFYKNDFLIPLPNIHVPLILIYKETELILTKKILATLVF